jgi:putative peptidoglycan lipid II flippase
MAAGLRIVPCHPEAAVAPGPVFRHACDPPMTSTLRAAGVISAFTLVSRILGLIRDRLTTQLLGATWVAGSFLMAWQFPNLLRRLLGEGALSASFLPAYTVALRKEGEPEARRLLSQVTGTVLAILLPLVAVVVVGSLLLPPAWIPAPDKEGGGEGIALLLVLNAILFPYTLPICLSALYSGAMNARRQFAMPAAVPIVLNVFWIAALLLVRSLHITALPDIALFLSWFLAVGGLAQLALVVVPLWRQGALARPRVRLRPEEPRARAVFVTMGPTVLGMSVTQINALVDQSLAYYLVAPGATAYVYLANRLLLFPHALTALALAVAVFPNLAAMAADGNRQGMRTILDRATAAMLVITLPATAGMIAIADDLVSLLFRHGAFTEADAVQTTLTTIWMVAGLPMIGLAQLTARAFYSAGDTRTPAHQAAWLMLVNLGLNLLFVAVFGLGTPGLAASTSITATLNAVLLARRIRVHAGSGSGLAGTWLRCGAATAVMTLGIVLLRPAAAEGAHWSMWALYRIAWPMVLATLLYFGTLWLLRAPELRALRRR